MPPLVDELVTKLLILCVQRADPLPSQSEPREPAIEREADEWVLRGIRGQGWEDPSPALASELVPRLRYAKFFGSIYASGMHDPIKSVGDPDEQVELLEMLLLKGWHETGKPSWLRGEWT